MTDHAAALRAPLSTLMLDAELPRSLRVLAADAHDAAELEAVLWRASKALVALESLEAEVSARVKQVREALLSVMEDTGAPNIDVGTHLIGWSLRKSVHVDEAALPPEFWSTPQPKPDTTQIRAALDRGEIVSGASLGNGTPSLFIRAKRK